MRAHRAQDGDVRRAHLSWGCVNKIHCFSATHVACLQPQCEPIEPKMVRRNLLIAHGAVPVLVQLLTYVPRLPEPAQVSVHLVQLIACDYWANVILWCPF